MTKAISAEGITTRNTKTVSFLNTKEILPPDFTSPKRLVIWYAVPMMVTERTVIKIRDPAAAAGEIL